MKFRYSIYCLILPIILSAQQGPLVSLDKVFINADSAELFSVLGKENIKSMVFISPDSAQALIGEFGDEGILLVESVDSGHDMVTSLTIDQFRPFTENIGVVVDGEVRDMAYMRSVDPRHIESMMIKRPLDAIMEYGLGMINGVIEFRMKVQ